jgi:phosphate transport system substrate-binding protein
MATRKIPRRVRALGGGAALLALAGVLAACDYGPDNVAKKITVVGSDTTQDVMARILLRYHFNQPTDYNKFDSSHDDMFNVLSVQNPGLAVPADGDCGARTWATPPAAGTHLAPNGSSAGRNALRDDTPGCVDIARSSAAPRAIGPTGDKATFEYYAFGVDGLGWSTHPSSPAPANLTLAQLQGIFNCTFTNWNQVGGGDGPIQRYWPQTGSGTFQSAVSELMGGVNPFTISNPPSCPAAISTQESSGELIAANGDQATALVPYSAGNWIAQANDAVNPDQRAGQELGNLNGFDFVVGSPGNFGPGSAIVEENVRLVDPTPAVPGIRFIFNVVDSAGPSYVTAKRYVGFDNQANGRTSPLCSNKFAADITLFGFRPLDTSAVDPSTNLANSNCRKYVPTA